MHFRGPGAHCAVVGLGAGALLSVGALLLGGPADAASCASTAVKGIDITRAIGSTAASAIKAPTGPLAFTGAAGVIGGLLIGAALLVAGVSFVLQSKRGGRALWVVMALCGLGVVALVGSHAASAAPVAATASCSTPVQAAPVSIPVPVGVLGTVVTAPGTGTTGTTGTTAPGGGPTGDPGTGPSGGTTVTPPAALPDASTPLDWSWSVPSPAARRCWSGAAAPADGGLASPAT